MDEDDIDQLIERAGASVLESLRRGADVEQRLRELYREPVPEADPVDVPSR